MEMEPYPDQQVDATRTRQGHLVGDVQADGNGDGTVSPRPIKEVDAPRPHGSSVWGCKRSMTSAEPDED